MKFSVSRIAALFGLVLLVGWGCTQKNTSTEQAGTAGPDVSAAQNSSGTPALEQTAAQAVVPSANRTPLQALKKAVGGQETAKTVKSPETYQKALGTYQYRLQFLNCQSNPARLTLKTGMPLMLDNRDSEKHTFKMGKQSFSVLGYDYVIAKAPTPGTYTIICDGGGAAEIQVQG